MCAGLGEGIWEWIGWFKSSRPPKGEHVHVLGPPLHETQGFEQVMNRAQRPRQDGHQRWPEQGAGDKGYSYAGVRGWLKSRTKQNMSRSA